MVIWDTDGKEYIDAPAGFAVSCLGYRHSDVIAEAGVIDTIVERLGDAVDAALAGAT